MGKEGRQLPSFLIEEAKMMDIEKVFYICDGERPECKKQECYRTHPDWHYKNCCYHTTDITHAMNFDLNERTGNYWEAPHNNWNDE